MNLLVSFFSFNSEPQFIRQSCSGCVEEQGWPLGFLLPDETLFEEHLPHFKGEENDYLNWYSDKKQLPEIKACKD